MTKTLIVGTGGHAQMLASWLLETQPDLALLFIERPDYSGPERLMDCPVLRENDSALDSIDVSGFYFGMGMLKANPTRWEVFQRLKARWKALSFIHPSALVAKSAKLGEGSLLGAGAIVQPFAELGEAIIVNTGAIVEHHCNVGKNTHVAPNATLCGDCVVGEHSMIGAGSTIIQGRHLAKKSTVGAGAVLTQNVLEPGLTLLGLPGRARG